MDLQKKKLAAAALVGGVGGGVNAVTAQDGAASGAAKNGLSSTQAAG